MSRTVLTQFGRALKQLGVHHIAAYSPQARGRSERAFLTLQDRLPKELKLAGITTVAAANRWLSETYMAQHNKQFAIAAEQEGSAFVADAMGAWREILCVQEDRTVGNDNTVKWYRLSLQLPPSRLRPHFVTSRFASLAGANETLARRMCGSTNILTVRWRCTGGRIGSPITMSPVPWLCRLPASLGWAGISSRDGMQGGQADGTQITGGGGFDRG